MDPNGSVVRDALDNACDRIWCEIRRVLARQRMLRALGEDADPEELEALAIRLLELRRYSNHYREVMRREQS